MTLGIDDTLKDSLKEYFGEGVNGMIEEANRVMKIISQQHKLDIYYDSLSKPRPSINNCGCIKK